MNKEKIIKNIGTIVTDLGSRSVEKSFAFGLYDYDIPEVLLKKKSNVNNVLFLKKLKCKTCVHKD